MKAISKISAAIFFLAIFGLASGQTLKSRTASSLTAKTKLLACQNLNSAFSTIFKSTHSVRFGLLTFVPGQTVAWDFGDGTGSRELEPLHQFSKSGSYLVTLTVYSPCGGQVSTAMLVMLGVVQTNVSKI